MKITKVDPYKIADSSLVTVTKMNHLVEVQHMGKMNRTCHIKKLDSDRYFDIETGEIKDFNKSENRSQNLNSLRQTFKKLRYLINNNFVGAKNELFVTLTYRGDLQTSDHLKVGKDYDNFLKRLKRRFKSQTTIDAIRVLEPHASGKWHLHVLFRFNELERIFIPNEVLAELWGNGFVTIQSLEDVDNIGAYVSAYLADMEITEENILSFVGKELDLKEIDGKKYVKGARLPFYKSGVNIFSKTKGIAYPDRQRMYYQEAKKIVGAATPHYTKSIELADEENDYFNTITYEQYNLKR